MERSLSAALAFGMALLGSTALANDNKILIPSLTQALAPQFECKPDSSMASEVNIGAGTQIEPRVWSVISDFSATEVTPNLKRTVPSRRFQGSYVRWGSFECGHPAYGLWDGSQRPVPFIYEIVVKKDFKYKPSQLFDLVLDTDFMKREKLPLMEEASSSFFQPAFTAPDQKEPKSVLPCIIKLEDMLSGRREINLKQLCAGHSDKDRLFTRNEISKWLSIWKITKKNPSSPKKSTNMGP